MNKNEVMDPGGSGVEKLFLIEGVDWDKAQVNMPGNEMLVEILKTFSESANMDIAELEEYFEIGVAAGDDEALESYKIKVHAMKHSAALFGADELSGEAKDLEYAARDGKRDFIRDFHSPFIEEYRRLALEIGNAVNADMDCGSKSMDNDDLLSMIDSLSKAMEEFDTITLNDLSFELGKYDFSSPELKEMVSRLQIAIRDFDEDEFNAVTNEIRNSLK